MPSALARLTICRRSEESAVSAERKPQSMKRAPRNERGTWWAARPRERYLAFEALPSTRASFGCVIRWRADGRTFRRTPRLVVRGPLPTPRAHCKFSNFTLAKRKVSRASLHRSPVTDAGSPMAHPLLSRADDVALLAKAAGRTFGDTRSKRGIRGPCSRNLPFR